MHKQMYLVILIHHHSVKGTPPVATLFAYTHWNRAKMNLPKFFHSPRLKARPVMNGFKSASNPLKPK